MLKLMGNKIFTFLRWEFLFKPVIISIKLKKSLNLIILLLNNLTLFMLVKQLFQILYQIFKLFGSRSQTPFCRSLSGSKLFAKGNFPCFCCCLPTFLKKNNYSFRNTLSECQMVWIQIRTKMFAKVICRLFSKLMFFKNTFRTTYNVRVSNSSYPDQDQHNVSPDLGWKCLQRLSADVKSHY